MKRINLFIAMVVAMAIATSSLISCGGGGDDDDDDDIACAPGEAEQLALLSGTWALDSINQDEDPLVQPLEGSISLTFDVDEEECSNNFFSVSGGEYLIENASNVEFSFVENTEFLRLNLGTTVAQISSISETSLVLVIDFTDPDDESSRVLRTGEYTLIFSKS